MWTAKTVVTLSLCFVENLLFAGTIYGWPSLAYVYKEQGLFSCDNNQTGQVGNGTAICPDQDRHLPLGLMVGLVGLGLGALAIGWLFDRYGLRIARTVTIVLGVSGSLCLAFANRNFPYLIFPGTFFTGTTSISMTTTNHHVALLAGKQAPVFNILYAGAKNSSGIIFFLIKLAYDYGFSQQWSLVILASLWGLVALTTFLLLPPFKVQRSKEAHESKVPERNGRNGLENDNLGADFTLDDHAAINGGKNYEKTKIGMTIISSKNADAGISKHHENVTTDIKTPTIDNKSRPGVHQQQPHAVKSVWYYVLSFGYLPHVVYSCLLQIWFGLVLGIMITWLTSIYEGDISQVSYYTNVYAYTQLACGLLLSPFAGGLTEGMRHFLEGKSGGELQTYARPMVTTPGLTCSSLAAILVAVFMLLEESWCVYPVFIFMEVARVFFYGNVAAYLTVVFPMEHFGMLYGVLFAVTAVLLSVQYGYVRWVEAAGYVPMVSFQLVMAALSLLHPIILTTQYLRKRRPNIIHNTRL